MKHIRLLTVLLLLCLLVWLGFQWAMLALPWPMVIHLMVPASALAIVLLPQFARVNRWLLAATLALLYLGLKGVVGAQLWGEALPSTILEVALMALTVLAAHWLCRSLATFDQFLTDMSLGTVGERRARQGEIYREIQRARTHQRPLGLLAVRPEAVTTPWVVERLVQEAQQTLQRQYMYARLSRAMCSVVAAHHIVAKGEDHFFILMPEATPEALSETTNRVRRAIREQVGIEVRIGAAVLPVDAMTFEGLVEKALAEVEAVAAAPAAIPAASGAHEPGLVPEGTHGNLDRQ